MLLPEPEARFKKTHPCVFVWRTRFTGTFFCAGGGRWFTLSGQGPGRRI